MKKRKRKARVKNIYVTPIQQLWQNFVNMPTEDREELSKYIEGLNFNKSPFIEYRAKDYLKSLFHSSECYH